MLPAASLENALQGGVTGLLMSSGDGQPGAGSQINIRGIGSINASSEPLYVIDVQTNKVMHKFKKNRSSNWFFAR